MQSIFSIYKHGVWALSGNETPTGNAAAIINRNFVVIADLLDQIPRTHGGGGDGRIVIWRHGWLDTSGLTDDQIYFHLADQDNPHLTTAAQVGAYIKSEVYNKFESYTRAEVDVLVAESGHAQSGFRRCAVPPPTAGAGDTYFNTTDKHAYLFSGDEWVMMDNQPPPPPPTPTPGLTLEGVCDVISTVLDAVSNGELDEESAPI